MVSIMKIWKIILAVLTIVAGIVLFDEAGLVLNKVRLASAFGADVGSIVMYAGYIVSILYIIISILFLVYLNKKDNKGEKIIIVLSIIAFIFSFLGPKLFEDLQFLSFCAILCLITATVSFFNNKKSQSGLADLKQHCPYCGAVLNDDSLFCTKCGKELPKRIACPHCGASMNEGDAFCPNCGKSKNEESVEHSEEQESQQAPDVSENNTSKKYLPIIIGVIVLAILGAGWWSYKSSMEKTNVNLDSLFTVNLEEVKEDVEGNPTDKLSQFRELQSFAQFGSDLDEDTLKKINRGKVLTEILKQPQYNPFDEVSEIIAIYSATSGCLDDVKIDNIMGFENKIVEYVKLNHKELIKKLAENKKLSEEILAQLKEAIMECKKTLI